MTLQEESGKAPYFFSEFYDTVKVTIPQEVGEGLTVAANNLDEVRVEISVTDTSSQTSTLQHRAQ